MILNLNIHYILLSFILASILNVTYAADAAKMFEENCSGCHTIGGGQTVGPDLKEVLNRHSRAWVIEYIKEPDVVCERKDPAAMELKKKFAGTEMPNLGLSQEDVEALVNWLEKSNGGSGANQETMAAAITGNAEQGEALFDGSVGLSAGGTACISCHEISGNTKKRGGTLGPNLTLTATKMGEGALLNALKTLPFPTMKPIYKNRPLSEGEQQDLAAYMLKASKTQSEEKNSFNIFHLGLGLSIVCLFAFNFIWIGRLRGVRKQMTQKGDE